MQILNSPVTVGKITVKNRLVMPPMANEKAQDGLVNQQHIDFYTERCKGGHIGLVITEHSYVNIQGKAGKGQLSVASDDCLPGMKALADSIHQCSCTVFAQISHAGGAALTAVTGMVPVSASRVMMPRRQKEYDMPLRLDKEGIKQIVRDFADAALRVKKAGFDGVEIHSAHGYLLNQFYSPLTNKRDDEYGADCMENRLRFLLETVGAVREAVGPDFPIAVRLGGCDYAKGGSTVRDAVQAAVMLEKAGVDLLDISGGFCSYRKPGDETPGYFSDMTQPIKQRVKIPVILTGGVHSGRQCEKLLEDGSADLIGVGRAILSDSAWAHKSMAVQH